MIMLFKNCLEKKQPPQNRRSDSPKTKGKGTINFNHLPKQKWLRIPFRNGLIISNQ